MRKERTLAGRKAIGGGEGGVNYSEIEREELMVQIRDTVNMYIQIDMQVYTYTQVHIY